MSKRLLIALLLGLAFASAVFDQSVESVALAAYDRTAPVIITFIVPATSATLKVTGITLSASDNVGVTGYYLSTSGYTPWAFSSGWTKTAPTSYAFSSAGTKTLYAWAKDTAGNVSARKSASVNITLDTQAPVVSIASPANNTTVSGLLTITASASDNVLVAKVEFYMNGVLKSTVTASPYTYSTDTKALANGSYTLTARAYDAAGNVGQSTTISITVNNSGPDTTPPSITAFSIPATATSLTVPITSFTATDNVGVAGYLLTETATAPSAGAGSWSSSAPTSYVFSTAGSKTLYAWAKDAAANVSPSSNASVVITLPDTVAPVVTSFVIPPTATSLAISVTSFTASDNVAVRGYLITESSAKPSASASGWSGSAPAQFTCSSAGTKTLYAWAKDAATNISASQSASIIISLPDTQAPTVSITSPANNKTVSGVLTIVASASDNVGVTKVEFYISGSLKSTAIASPYKYSVDTTAMSNGSYSLTARAYDAAGNVGRSSTVTVVVSNPVPIVFETNASSTSTSTISSPYNTLAMWTPGTVSPADAAASPMIRYVCFFNATGGKVDMPEDEIYDEDAAGNPVYHFDRLTSKLDTVLAAGFKPYLALSFTPIKLASNPSAISSEFSNNTSPPKDWNKYYNFIKALFTTLSSTYGIDEVASWRFRCTTEPDNTGWWTGTMQDWFKFYDYTVSAARVANAGVHISPGNFMNYATSFVGALASRIQAGTFSIAGEKPYVPPAMSISYYQDNPTYIADAVNSVRNALASYPAFAGIPLAIDEGYILDDENGRIMYSRLDGTELGGSHFALLTTAMVGQNLQWGALWNTGSAEVPPPGRNVLDLFQRLIVGGINLGLSRFFGQPSGSDLVGGMAVRSAGGTAGQLRLMLYNYNGSRSAGTTEPVRLRLRGMPASSVNVTYYRIDRDHANYSVQWLIDSAGMSRSYYGFELSPYDLNPTDGMSPDGIDLWNSKKSIYAALAQITPEIEATPRVPAADGTLEIPVSLPHHGVVFVQVDPVGQVP